LTIYRDKEPQAVEKHFRKRIAMQLKSLFLFCFGVHAFFVQKAKKQRPLPKGHSNRNCESIQHQQKLNQRNVSSVNPGGKKGSGGHVGQETPDKKHINY
jgi:hypothetical protein